MLGPTDSRDSLISTERRLDAALHREWSGPGLSTCVPRALLHSRQRQSDEQLSSGIANSTSADGNKGARRFQVLVPASLRETFKGRCEREQFKRGYQVDFSLSQENISAILIDIEGTTTPIAFVYEVLFPFARSRVKDFLENHFELAALQEDLSRLRAEHHTDLLENLNP